MLVFFFFLLPSAPVSVRSETHCCFVGIQLEGIILVAACVSGFRRRCRLRLKCETHRNTEAAEGVQAAARRNTSRIRGLSSSGRVLSGLMRLDDLPSLGK